jgi:hypothetical protein
MKRFLSFALFILTALAFVSADEQKNEIDDSSYDSLYKAARGQNWRGNGTLFGFSQTSLEAIIKHSQFDLLESEFSAYWKAQTGKPDFYPLNRRAGFTVEPLFREGRIDEGVALLKILFPPQNEADGLLCTGYVSDALIEQKRFDLAWQLANSDGIEEYIRKTTDRKKVRNEVDIEIYRKEANRAFEHLLKMTEGAKPHPYTLVDLGRYEEAYNLFGIRPAK